MNLKQVLTTKAELLCYGIRVEDEITKDYILRRNKYFFEKGFIHASHLKFNGQMINTCASENFCASSPYEVRLGLDGLRLYKNDEDLGIIGIIELPKWCNDTIEGLVIGDYVRPHSDGCIACWPKLRCTYIQRKKQCAFCSMRDYTIHNVLDEQIVVDMLNIALEYNTDYEVALSGGTCNAPDHSAKYFSNICRGIKESGAKYISVELAPPEDSEDLYMLHESGATAVIMNLEVANDINRKKICPGKSEISEERYLCAFEDAVKIFGRGNVSSVLISGIQNKEDIVNKSKSLIDIGVIPTIIPFKPLDFCDMKDHQRASPIELIDISSHIGNYMVMNQLYAACQKGCTKCNGCSIETITEEIKGGKK